jgi:hypothetical protein
MTPESHVIPGINNSKCVSYSDPSLDMLKNLNLMMFNIGAGAAQQQLNESMLDPGLLVNTTTMGYRKGHHNVFQTDLRWFGAAATVEALCIALILPTYFGYWRLGRKVSFSPLEIAKVSLKHLKSRSSSLTLLTLRRPSKHRCFLTATRTPQGKILHMLLEMSGSGTEQYDHHLGE